MLDFLESLDSKKAFASSKSFFDLAWRERAFYTVLKSDSKNIPPEFKSGCVVSSDALHLLNVFRQFKKATLEEFTKVIVKMGGPEWVESDYVRFHLKMYCDSFYSMRLLNQAVKEEPVKNTTIAFIPVFTNEEPLYEFNTSMVESYQANGLVQRTNEESYISLSVNDGFLASKGQDEDEEASMTN